MKLPRRKFLHLATAAAAFPSPIGNVSALDYPTRPVHIVVGFPPGGAPDIIARLVGQWLSERLDQQFFVDNRPGAAGNIGTEVVARRRLTAIRFSLPSQPLRLTPRCIQI